MKGRSYATAGAIAAAAIAAVVAWVAWPEDHHPSSTGGQTGLTIPAFTAEAEAGQVLFDESCMTCHGPHATGSDQGPPLVHKIYEPNHHGDMSFRLAVRNGVRSHHWDFGNMAPVEGVSDDDVEKIIVYVRTLQQANGIF